MNNNKVEGSNRNKTMKKQKLKEKITPIDDDGAKVHRSLANSGVYICCINFYYIGILSIISTIYLIAYLKRVPFLYKWCGKTIERICPAFYILLQLSSQGGGASLATSQAQWSSAQVSRLVYNQNAQSACLLWLWLLLKNLPQMRLNFHTIYANKSIGKPPFLRHYERCIKYVTVVNWCRLFWGLAYCELYMGGDFFFQEMVLISLVIALVDMICCLSIML